MKTPDGKLLVFTDSFPYGKGESFLETEIPYLAERFESVTLIPRRYGGRQQARAVPDCVRVEPPICSRDSRFYLALNGLFNTAPLAPMIGEFFRSRAYASPARIVKWAEATFLARHTAVHQRLLQILADSGPRPILYFYWSSGLAWALPFLPHEGITTGRFHGFDLYEERKSNHGYIPLRTAYLRHLDHACFVSEHGKDYATSKYPDILRNARVERLGVTDAGQRTASEDGVLRIASCARTVPLKRLDLIVDALMLIQSPVEWVHLGDGPSQAEIMEKSRGLPGNITATFPGALPNEDIRAFYATHPVDLFVNMSETEGAPVSVMEALAAGIPVYATAAGGTPELVDDTVGKLFPISTSPEDLATAIKGFAENSEERRKLSINARDRWEQVASADTNYRAFAEFLHSLR